MKVPKASDAKFNEKMADSTPLHACASHLAQCVLLVFSQTSGLHVCGKFSGAQ